MTRSERRSIGITTTVPLEPFFSSDIVPVDLNNSFIQSEDPARLVEDSQVIGFPRNICTWIKGLYPVGKKMDGVVGVVRGDCSNTESLLEVLSRDGVRVHPFSYPPDRAREELVDEIEALCRFLGTDIEEAGRMSRRVEELRALALKVDELRWRYRRITAEETHITLVSTSDFSGDADLWDKNTRDIMERAVELEVPDEGPRLGFIGVPPIITDLFPRIEKMGGDVVFFEVQRQFAMPGSGKDWIDRYLEYTYPYDLAGRVEDILKAVDERKLDGIVHYIQSFCHRGMDDMVFRKELDLPILTVEGNLPGPMDERTAIRMESFLDVLQGGP